MASGEVLKLVGVLKGHTDWVTQVVTTPENPDILVSASRGMLIFHLVNLSYSLIPL